MNRHASPEDSELYALGALDGEEKRELEAHVRLCPECAQTVDLAGRRAALLGLGAPAAAPSPAVKQAILERIRAERARGADQQMSPEPRRAALWAWLTPVFGVAALVFAALAAVLWMRDARDLQRIHHLESQLALAQSRSLQIARASEETNKLLEMPGTKRVALMPMPGMPEGSRAGVLYNAKMGMVACAGWLPAPPPNKTWQLWLVPMEGKPMPLRVMGGGEWTEPVTAHVTPGMEVKAFAVTEEPEGGMPWPTGPKVLAGAGE